MTADEFRQLALALPGAVESAHMNHPDFRLGGRIFATLGASDEGWGVVKLTLELQSAFVAEAADIFQPCNGAWGKGGATYVRLASANRKLVASALKAAGASVLVRQRKPRRGPGSADSGPAPG